ncbi:hypothetical protein [Desertivirga brevis]|uniref:hypothetical protein n=1 Tax=Desertivirga brevis TaxID=2810310 RepID=UPI001A97113C|nr:hypothetical protein [Pedobacter sp. SYSU D00873]
MKSQRHFNIQKEVSRILDSGKGDKLLQKLEFEYVINNKEEFANYLTIITCFIENSFFREAGSNLLLRKILKNLERYRFLSNSMEAFEILREIAIFPYVGLSQMVKRLIATIIYQREDDFEIIKSWPDKDYLANFNIYLLRSNLEKNPKDAVDATQLLYNCVIDILKEDSRIILSSEATKQFKSHLDLSREFLMSYLSCFIRFKWYGGSREWSEGREIVPEPFYTQIFGSAKDFIAFLEMQKFKESSQADSYKLISDIVDFIKAFLTREVVLYDRIDIQVNLHKHLIQELKPNRQ